MNTWTTVFPPSNPLPPSTRITPLRQPKLNFNLTVWHRKRLTQTRRRLFLRLVIRRSSIYGKAIRIRDSCTESRTAAFSPQTRHTTNVRHSSATRIKQDFYRTRAFNARDNLFTAVTCCGDMLRCRRWDWWFRVVLFVLMPRTDISREGRSQGEWE